MNRFASSLAILFLASTVALAGETQIIGGVDGGNSAGTAGLVIGAVRTQAPDLQGAAQKQSRPRR
jgi:hypothetical protein